MARPISYDIQVFQTRDGRFRAKIEHEEYGCYTNPTGDKNVDSVILEAVSLLPMLRRYTAAQGQKPEVHASIFQAQRAGGFYRTRPAPRLGRWDDR